MNKRVLAGGFVILCGLLAFVTGPGWAADETGWVTDFEAAKAAAAKENKDLLVDFTGSDWCGWCIKLKKEVFDQDVFKKEAPKSFVLVELDFPKTKELDAKLKEQNEKLMQKFGIQGFPTILLMDSKGEVYGRTGYRDGGPEKYLEHLTKLKTSKAKMPELLAQAEKAEGVEKAKLLDQYLELAAETGKAEGLEAKVEEIMKLDAENKAGLKGKYGIRKKMAEVQEAETPDAAMAKVEAIIKEFAPKGEELQKILLIKGQIFAAKNDKAGMLAQFKAAKEAAPESDLAKKIDEFLKQQAQEKKE